MKLLSKIAILFLLPVVGVIDAAAQNPFDVNTTVTGVKTVGQPSQPQMRVKESTGNTGLVFKYGNLHYKILSEKTAEVSGEVRSVCKGRVEIPNIVKHNNKTYTVVGIGSQAFYNQKELKEVVVPKTVQYIDKMAFGFSGLTEVIIPGDNVKVKDDAFINCKNLRLATLSGKNPSYTYRSFQLCYNMTELRIRDCDPKLNGTKVARSSAVIKVMK